jgi:hypothetical protein
MTTWASFPDVKRPGCEANHEVKNEWGYTPNPFMISWYIGDIFAFIYKRVYVSHVSYIYTYMRRYLCTRTLE